MNSNNILLKADNVSLKNDIKTCYVICIFLDIRNSTEINEKNNSKELYKIYSDVLNKTYEELKRNGFKNIEIQGDGIYALFPFRNELNKISTINNTIKNIAIIMDRSYDKYNIKSAISIRFGKEWYSAFGESNNNKKRLSFFGNVVSKTKKMNSLAKNGKIIISKSEFSNKVFDNIKNSLENKGDELYLKNGKIIGPVYLIK